ncbi:MAG: hypothetical protein EOO61_15365 [Hymenobacter sp.]|nr:MAG: hypothetical protein EOO61_15365 [Hymenobacter sp.]
MTKNAREIKLDEVKLKVADVVINLNFIEREIKNCISYYVSSNKSYFVSEILLNNHIVSMANKIKVLQYIIREEKIEIPKNFMNALQVVMNKRNVLAHSDTVLEDYTIDDVDVECEPDGVTYSPIYKDAEPGAWVFSQGDVNFDTVDKIVADFDKYFKIASDELARISQLLRLRFSSL